MVYESGAGYQDDGVAGLPRSGQVAPPRSGQVASPRSGQVALSRSGQVALVTGGTAGLGLAIAAAVARAGSAVVLASRSAARCEQVAARLSAETGRLVQARGTLDQFDVKTLRACLEVHVVGTWLACRAAARPMRAAGYGRILTLASALGLVGASARSGYAASKGAVVRLTRSLAVELAGTGITVSALAPRGRSALRSIPASTTIRRYSVSFPPKSRSAAGPNQMNWLVPR